MTRSKLSNQVSGKAIHLSCMDDFDPFVFKEISMPSFHKATTLIVPSDMTQVSSLIGSAMKMVQNQQAKS